MRMKRPTLPLGRNRTSYRCRCARGGKRKNNERMVAARVERYDLFPAEDRSLLFRRQFDPLAVQDAALAVVIEAHVIQIGVAADHRKVQIRRCSIEQGKVSVGPAPRRLLGEE